MASVPVWFFFLSKEIKQFENKKVQMLLELQLMGK